MDRKAVEGACGDEPALATSELDFICELARGRPGEGGLAVEDDEDFELAFARSDGIAFGAKGFGEIPAVDGKIW